MEKQQRKQTWCNIFISPLQFPRRRYWERRGLRSVSQVGQGQSKSDVIHLLRGPCRCLSKCTFSIYGIVFLLKNTIYSKKQRKGCSRSNLSLLSSILSPRICAKPSITLALRMHLTLVSKIRAFHSQSSILWDFVCRDPVSFAPSPSLTPWWSPWPEAGPWRKSIIHFSSYSLNPPVLLVLLCVLLMPLHLVDPSKLHWMELLEPWHCFQEICALTKV